MFGFTKRKRRQLMAQPFPEEWQAVIDQQIPYFLHLPAEHKHKLKGLIHIFLDEKAFEGCAGLKVTEEMRLCIAGQACVLLLGIEDLSSFYPDLRSILVYPEAYFAKIKEHQNTFFINEGMQHRSGESWTRGEVVLAWSKVKQGSADPTDGRNLVFHEFAHQLDYEYNATGFGEEDDSPWAQIIRQEYQRLVEALHNNEQTFIDDYGATNRKEFFAVVSEHFFEQPGPLQKHHPELYEQFKAFYHQDPTRYT